MKLIKLHNENFIFASTKSNYLLFYKQNDLFIGRLLAHLSFYGKFRCKCIKTNENYYFLDISTIGEMAATHYNCKLIYSF